MLGHRGCRIAVSYPEIYEMQVRAIFEAVYTLKKEGVQVDPEIMIPIIMNENELGLYQFSGGVDLNLFNFLYGFAEVQGFNPKAPVANQVVNAGVKLRLGFLSAGIGMFNVKVTPGEGDTFVDQYASSILDLANANYMATVAIDIKLGGKKAAAKK